MNTDKDGLVKLYYFIFMQNNLDDNDDGHSIPRHQIRQASLWCK